MDLKISNYHKFRCIADQCTFTCCQEWRIGVDADTLKKWQGLKLQADLIIAQCVKKDGDGHVISLNQDKKCPFLNEEKLCRLVLELGEGYLSETCATFPRQINHFEDRTEYSLDPGCPVVVDLLNDSLNQIEFHQEGELLKEPSLLYFVREMILSIMEKEAYSLPERLMITFYTLLELLEQKQLKKEKIESLTSPQALNLVAEAIRGMRFNLADSFFECNELFLDVVENYRKQKLYVDYLETIAQRAEELEGEYDEAFILDKVLCFEKELLVYEKLIKNYLIAEIFGNCLMQDMTLEDVVMGFEWVTLEYVVLRQVLFLKWFTEGEKALEYTKVRDYINVISRVTGYEVSDIREYLENSFESTIWEWGYLALIVGNSRL